MKTYILKYKTRKKSNKVKLKERKKNEEGSFDGRGRGKFHRIAKESKNTRKQKKKRVKLISIVVTIMWLNGDKQKKNS